MKKIMLFLVVVVMLVSLSGVVIGAEAKAVDKSGVEDATIVAEDQAVKKGDAKSASKAGVKPKSRRGGSAQVRGREMMAAKQAERMAAEIERATKAHDEFAAELTVIKKLAEKEGAKETAAKIQELIDKDKKKLDKKKDDMKNRSEEFMKRMKAGPARGERVRPAGTKRRGDGENKRGKNAGAKVPEAKKAVKDDADKD